MPKSEKDVKSLQHMQPSRQKDQSQVSDAIRRKLEEHPAQGLRSTVVPSTCQDTPTLTVGTPLLPKQTYQAVTSWLLHANCQEKTYQCQQQPWDFLVWTPAYQYWIRDHLENPLTTCPECQQVQIAGCLPHQTRKPSPLSTNSTQLHSHY